MDARATPGASPVAAPSALRSIDELPGPRGLPFIGNLLQVDRAHVHARVEQWCREYGTLFRFSLARRARMLVVADHEAFAAVLRDRPDGFRRTRHLQTIGQEMALTPGLFGAEGDAWRRQRRMVMAGLDPGRVRAYFPSLLKVTRRLHGRWQRAASEPRAIDLQADLMRVTVDAITGLAFGADVNTLESDDDVIQRHLDKIFPALFRRVMSPLPTWRWFKLPADRRLDASIAAVNAAIAGFIAQARERLARDPSRREHPPNLLEAMIVAADEDGSGIDDKQVAGNVLTMLLAGEDTTANTLAWMIHLLHRHPAALQRAIDEVRRMAPDAAAFTPERMAALEWLDACINETMRLKPVAPFIVVEALREARIADVQVPAGALVWGAIRHDSLDERHFADAAAFRPERWLGGDAAGAASSAQRISMPFGAGPRVCPGRYLALLEMKMAMAMLLGGFAIDSVDAPGGGEAEERMSFTMVPVGLRMRLRERV